MSTDTCGNVLGKRTLFLLTLTKAIRYVLSSRSAVLRTISSLALKSPHLKMTHSRNPIQRLLHPHYILAIYQRGHHLCDIVAKYKCNFKCNRYGFKLNTLLFLSDQLSTEISSLPSLNLLLAKLLKAPPSLR